MEAEQPDYVPILKAREAEIKAVLKAPPALQVTPLFELQPASGGTVDAATGASKRSKATTTDASYFLDDIARLWDGPLYVDISRVAQPHTRPAWWNLLAALNALAPVPAQLIPVLVPGSTGAEVAAAAATAVHTGRLAVRVPMAQAWPNPGALTGLTATISSGAAGIPSSSVDVVLDWADTTEMMTLDALTDATRNAIAALGGQHGHVIIGGTPNSAAFQQAGDWERHRREWWLWLRLRHEGLDAVYGDYALYPPADPVRATPQYGHLRYSSGDVMHVHRRAKPAGGGGLGAAFEACCVHVVGQPHFLGAGFSGADGRIHDIAHAADKESVAGKWRQLAAEHHFALVAGQLASPPAPPPAGTP